MLVWLFFNQIKDISWPEWNSFAIKNPLFLVFVVLLVFVNWGFEYLKWKETLDFSQIYLEPQPRIKSFLAGIITGLVTPNMIGNFIGRIFYFQRRDRPTIILLTLFSNAAQFLASLFFGIIAVLWLGLPAQDFSWPIDGFLILILSIFLILITVYLAFEKIPIRFLQQNKYVKRIIPLMQEKSYFRTRLLLLSLSRHFIFSLQYWLLLLALGVEINIEWFGWIWQVFFWATLIPSLWFGKLVIRETMALLILAPLTDYPALILLASVFLWILNQAVPAATGIPYLRTNNSKKS